MFSLKPFRTLVPLLKPYKNWLLFSLLMAIPLSILRVGPIPLVKFLVDDVLVNKNEHRLFLLPFAVVGLYALNLGVRFFHYYAIRIVVIHVNQAIKEKLFNHLIHLSSDYFTEQKTGVLLSRITADPSNLDNGISSLNVLIREPVTFLGLLIYAFYTNWRLAILTLLIVPLLALLLSMTGKYIKKKIAFYQQKNGESYSTIQEAITGNRVIHLFNLEKATLARFNGQMNYVTELLLKISKIEELASPLVELVISFAIALILYYGGASVLHGRMTSGDLIAFFTAFAMMINPIKQFSDITSKIASATAAMERINEFMSWESKIKHHPHPQTIHHLREGIEFKNVSFAYPDSPDRNVVQALSFKIPAGKTVALVGQSGSGKSSVVQLLTRLYDITDGQIVVDQHDLKSLELKNWREKVAVVSQDVFLFHDTIYQNILMGKPSATREEVIDATQRAFAYDFIQGLPEKFETIVGDRGVKLSGGERQRISIARAFLKNAEFLILDEATSNLDNQSEKIVQQTLDTLMQNKTTLVIAHRLSTIRNVDEIIVMGHGEILERGHFDQLIEKNGEFKRLATLAGMS